MAGSPGQATQTEPTCYRHPDRVTYVRCTRCDRPICGEDQISASVGFQCPDDVRAGNRGVRGARTAFGGLVRDRPLVTQTLVGLNVAVFLATLAGGATLALGSGASPLYDYLAQQPIRLDDGSGPTDGIADGQVWRLLTSMFLHYGGLHLLFNMVALLQIGPMLESALGRVRFLTLYLMAGLAGSALSYTLGPETARAAGASGAVYGLAAGLLLLARRRRQGTGPIVAFLFLGLLISQVPGIDLWGHVGGFLGGAAVASVFFAVPPGRRRTLVQAVGVVAVLLVVAGLVTARTVSLRGTI